jgi:hypothetical protein
MPVGAPGSGIAIISAPSHLLLCASAVRVFPKKLVDTLIAIAGKRDLPTIRRPNWANLVSRIESQVRHELRSFAGPIEARCIETLRRPVLANHEEHEATAVRQERRMKMDYLSSRSIQRHDGFCRTSRSRNPLQDAIRGE